jgi:predicted aspartyl protease
MFCWGLSGLILAPALLAGEPAIPPATPAADSDTLSEVVIEAPEPVYVAPTLRDRIGRIWAPVSINGKGPFRLVLDTGASRSAVIEHVAQKLGSEALAPKSILVYGVTGQALVPAVRVDRMEVGELLMSGTSVPIVADVFGGAEGVLGREGLLDKRIFADFVADRLVISRSHGEHAKNGYVRIPLKLLRGGLLAADVRVGAVRTRAIIDTGGQQTVGNLALQQALRRHTSPEDATDGIIGVTLDVQPGTTIAAPPIAFGDIKLTGVNVTFSDVALFQHWNLQRDPTLLLGMDVLGLFDVLIIDYKMHELQILPRGHSEPFLRTESTWERRGGGFP